MLKYKMEKETNQAALAGVVIHVAACFLRPPSYSSPFLRTNLFQTGDVEEFVSEMVKS